VTFGFHSPQVAVSVQIAQTQSAGADVSRDLPCSAIFLGLLLAVGAAANNIGPPEGLRRSAALDFDRLTRVRRNFSSRRGI
jgi:hypothetical protein